ncbi:MAG: cytochrome c [Verrucomicrobia bacterium]|nr:cytochrome c [Verrucomicrobiota bacterium]
MSNTPSFISPSPGDEKPPTPHIDRDEEFSPEPAFTSEREESAFQPHAGKLIHEEERFDEIERSSEMDVGAVHDRVLREAGEQARGFVPVPGLFLALFFAIAIWAGIYLGTYSGGFRGNIFSELPGAGGKPGPPPDPRVIGQKLFLANCAQCHQASGQGQPGQFPPLAGSEWVVGDAPNRLTQILLHGLQGTVHVKGLVFNNQMPPWKTLKDEQIAAILTYVRSEWGNAAPPITKEQMAAARKKTADRSDSWTEAQLLAIPAGPMEGGDANAAPPAAAQPPAK